MGYLNLPYIILVAGRFISNQVLMATSAIWVYLVELGGKPDFRLPGF